MDPISKIAGKNDVYQTMMTRCYHYRYSLYVYVEEVDHCPEEGEYMMLDMPKLMMKVVVMDSLVEALQLNMFGFALYMSYWMDLLHTT